MHPDRLRKFLFERAQIRGSIVRLDNAWQAVLARHDYPEAVRTVLGELFAAGALLAATLKFEKTFDLNSDITYGGMVIVP